MPFIDIEKLPPYTFNAGREASKIDDRARQEGKVDTGREAEYFSALDLVIGERQCLLHR